MQLQIDNSYTSVINAAKDLENMLELKFQAKGKGLHEKVTSVEAQLPEILIRRIRKIASIRNKLVHEKNYQLTNLTEFEADYNWCKTQLEEIKISSWSLWVNRIKHSLFNKADADRIQFPFLYWILLSFLLPHLLTKGLLHGNYWQQFLFVALTSLIIILAALLLSILLRYLSQLLKISWVVAALSLAVIVGIYYYKPFYFQDLEMAFRQIFT